MEGIGCGFFLVAAEVVQRQSLQATNFSIASRETSVLQALWNFLLDIADGEG